jgi:hypothetical protein
MDFSSIYPEHNCKRFLLAVIAVLDWQTNPYISIGFLCLFPILLVAGFLPPWQITLGALLCTVLQEPFSERPSQEAVTRLLTASTGFVGAGFFVLNHSEPPGDVGTFERGKNLKWAPLNWGTPWARIFR